jgi:hypothetical protein
MDQSIDTVRIEHPDVPTGVVINADDFDKDKHVLFGQKPAPVREKLTLTVKDQPANTD